MSKESHPAVRPPLWVAWNQAVSGIRVRLMRQALTSAGIMLGTAFFASMQTLRTVESAAGNLDQAGASRLTWLVVTSLLMCLVGITNAMLMSVAERYREIGTIKCLGAPDGFIVMVFFMESLILGAIGSGLGSLVGSAFMGIMLSVQGYSVTLFSVLPVFALSVTIGIAITVVAAILPAVQAAKMPAAAALRVEV
ncbi:MAG: FtsX-like permease family protein [Fimbriimonadaceae bacterium]|nr:FtsX-like permease family protein [Fimbriimonadaceae bacterium]